MFQFLYFSVLPIFFFAVFLLKWLSTLGFSHKNFPPSPFKLPILGNLHQLGPHPHRTLRSLAQKHGPLMLLHFGSKPAVIISSADAAREIMKTHDLNFSNRPKSSIADRLLYDSTDVSTAPYGEYWRRMKSIYVLQLLSTKKVQSFRSVREEEAELVMKKIKEFSSKLLPVNLSEMLLSYTNDVICRVAFGRKYGGGHHQDQGSGKRFKVLFDEFMLLLDGLNVGDFIPWLKWVNTVNGIDAKVERVAKEFDEFLDGVVEEHIQKKECNNGDHKIVEGDEDRKDFVDTLLQIQKDNSCGFPIDGVAIKALILDAFAAGSHTSYTVLEWVMTELLRHPRVLKKLQNEIRGITCCKRNVTDPDLDKMQYLKAVMKETLRLHPPIPLLVPRESAKDVNIMGYDIEAGAMVVINAWTIGRDPAIWDDPEEFKPERFLVNNSIDYKGNNFQLIPFGAGRRICPGILFAMASNELLLANLVNKFDWRLPGGARGEDLDMSESTGLTKHKKFPLHAVASIPSSQLWCED